MARHPDPLPLATVTAVEFPTGLICAGDDCSNPMPVGSLYGRVFTDHLVGAHEDDVWEWAELVCPRCAALAYEEAHPPSLYRRLLARLTGALR